jgi:hypothetical protein
MITDAPIPPFLLPSCFFSYRDLARDRNRKRLTHGQANGKQNAEKSAIRSRVLTRMSFHDIVSNDI